MWQTCLWLFGLVGSFLKGTPLSPVWIWNARWAIYDECVIEHQILLHKPYVVTLRIIECGGSEWLMKFWQKRCPKLKMVVVWCGGNIPSFFSLYGTAHFLAEFSECVHSVGGAAEDWWNYSTSLESHFCIAGRRIFFTLSEICAPKNMVMHFINQKSNFLGESEAFFMKIEYISRIWPLYRYMRKLHMETIKHDKKSSQQL